MQELDEKVKIYINIFMKIIKHRKKGSTKSRENGNDRKKNRKEENIK